MLIYHETACKPYGTLFAVLHHPYFPAVVSNSLTLLQPYLGDNQGVTFVLIISLMLYSIKRNPSERIADQCVQTRPPKLTRGPAGTLGADTFGKVLHTCLPKKTNVIFCHQLLLQAKACLLWLALFCYFIESSGHSRWAGRVVWAVPHWGAGGVPHFLQCCPLPELYLQPVFLQCFIQARL